MDGVRRVWVVLFQLTAWVSVADGLRCLSCVDIMKPELCTALRNCGPHEVCFMDAFVSPNGIIKFNLGCKDTLQCNVQPINTTTPRTRATNDVLVCEECCSTDLCSLNSCGNNAVPPPGERGPFCFHCDYQATPDGCDRYTMCSRDEHCMLKIDPTSNKFTSGCESEQTCVTNYNFYKAILIGRRDGPVHNVGAAANNCVSKCCDEDFCNDNCNGTEVIHPTPTTDTVSITTPEVPIWTDIPTTSTPVSTTPMTVVATPVTTTHTPIATTTIPPTTRIVTTTPRAELASAHTEAVPAGPCSSNPCMAGTCQALGPYYHCICPDGFTGKNCEIPPDLCASNPCLHGNCTNKMGEYECTCEYGYYGDRCETRIDPCFSNPCVHGKCSSFGNFFYCQCPQGYSGLDCHIPPSPCASNPCMHGTCEDHGPGYICKCPVNFSGDKCEIERNPCWSNPCVHGTCVRAGTEYVCNCTDGYTGTNCEQFPDACLDTPCVHGTCHKYLDSYVCECNMGFTGTNCDKFPDPCISNPCSHGTCIQNDTSFYCNCSNGYDGPTCQLELKPCDSNPCFNQAVCTNTGNHYTCDCINGFRGERCEISPDPCDSSPCIHGNCSSNGTTFICTCHPGYTNETCNSEYCYKDVVFIVDESGSVGNRNFNATLYMIADILRQLNIAPNGTHTGFMSFSTQPYIHWNLNKYMDLSTTLAGLSKVSFRGGQTNFEPALTMARNFFLNDTGERPGAENVVVLLSDGGEINQNQQHFHDHNLLQALSHDVISIVTTETQGASSDIDSMKELASDNHHFLSAPSYNQLSTLVHQAIQLICG